MEITFIRFERKEVPLPEYDKLHHVSNEEEAATLAGELGKVVYLTTGSKTMHVLPSPKLYKIKKYGPVYYRRRKCYNDGRFGSIS